jgi:glycosyltransferase involved in cell wall biosynthesis
MLGFRPDARRLMRALDALVIPSEAESFGMAAVEGLEAGIPVVGPDCWGPREIIEAPCTGLLFKPRDTSDLAHCVTQALTGEGLGAGFDPLAGPARVESLFTVAAHARRTLEIYRQLAPAIAKIEVNSP